ncbi:MAG TPA: flagellar basal-body MS-ring/collar protein FliF [Burkholderiaceae bacterium]|nr:flagellar basal-body MS-ring/collar protein FliF [Burkholderiaceae bacterium]
MENAVVSSTVQPASMSVFAQMSPRTKGMLVLGAALLAAVIAAAWLWSASPTYRILFTNLSDRDGGAIVAALSQMNIPHKNADGGTILVPQDKVHDARLKLASQGLPKGSVVGFELMETQKFGVTQFQEQINYQRALEGELARSISALAPVAQARVHLALPKQSGFLRDKQPPTASVLLQLHAGKALDRTQVAGIVHLVSSSVPELNPKQVSIVDQHGNLLASQRDGAAGLDAAQLDYMARIESDAIKRIETILEPIVGRGNVRAQVTVDVDFSQVENVAETYGPNQGAERAAIRSQSTQESSTPGPAVPQGVPGALSNQPPVPPTAPINGPAGALNANQPGVASSSNATRRDAMTNFEVDKTVRHTRGASGQIRRLTAAVVINSTSTVSGAAPAAALSKDDISALVREAMGFSQQRGDSLNVVHAPFNQPELPPVEAVPVWKQPDAVALAKESGKAMLFLLLTMIVVFGVVRPALRSIGARPVAQIAVEPERPALPTPETPAPFTPIQEVRELAKRDPATVANVVKAWVGSDSNKVA